ncbi:TMP-TENI-domain-containing protein [Periconia macrospinosa]|uniref:TMP-TENI-domain-containing protein n=1 Tax=Periconia macrospinosa TaxID=97972 RepID=A0A2V1E235_9PLEO|nr:TMP-TENI-domain-containing protein [Periconia macrospinosa]
MKPEVDYSLYLVTDSTEAILGNRDLISVVEQALQGGVTIVQYRDKTSDTGVLIRIARALHEKCKQYSIPLIINDRVDVALAVGCEGVHLGQDDMSVTDARNILGPSKIIGATVSSVEEARIAVERGADYLGIGTLYATNTKKNTKDIIGIAGTRKILESLSHPTSSAAAKQIKTVCIGGINATNIQRILYQLHYSPFSSPSPPTIKPISGAAIVSAIIASSTPKHASSLLRSLITTSTTHPTFLPSNFSPSPSLPSPQTLLNATLTLHKTNPLTHNMTNLVVQNLAANVALNIGASPIMSTNGTEARDLAALHGALVVNMGTSTPEALTQYKLAIEAYNAVGGPVILDPVGAGATAARKDALRFLLGVGYFTVIKGNESEILEVARASHIPIPIPIPSSSSTTTPSPSSSPEQPQPQQQRGVDSTHTLTHPSKLSLVKTLASTLRCTILMTGPTDILSNGTTTLSIKNGHEYLGRVTGTGCTLGTTISAYLAAAAAASSTSSSSSPNDSHGPESKDEVKNIGVLEAALASVLHFEIAAEDAAASLDVKGAGSFVPAFLDALAAYREGVVEGRLGEEWLRGRMRVE